MRRPLVLVTVLVLALSAGTISRGQVITAQTQGTYIALGDSIAFGVGSSLPERRGYPALVRSYLETYLGSNVDLTNLAVPGETAASFIANGQLDAFISRVNETRSSGGSVEYVTLTLGGNEMLAQRYGSVAERQQSLDNFRESIESAVAGIRVAIGSDSNLVLTTYYDVSEGDLAVEASDAWWIEQFNFVIRDTAARHDAGVAEIGEAFLGRIDEYTHMPFDVHPENQGFRAIARQVWRALALDNVPPEIDVLSASDATRRTPTLQLNVSDNVDVALVDVTVGEREPVEPLHLGDGRYILLLDLRGDDETEYDIVVEAEDSAGNRATTEHRLVVQID